MQNEIDYNQSSRAKLVGVKIAGKNIGVMQIEAIQLSENNYFNFEMPNFSHIFFDAANKHFLEAKKIIKNLTIKKEKTDISALICSDEIKAGKNQSNQRRIGWVSYPENNNDYYDYIVSMVSATILVFSAVESFANHQIDKYLRTDPEKIKQIKELNCIKKGQSNDSYDLQRYQETSFKLKKILPLLHGKDFGRDNSKLSKFETIKKIRDGFIHLKPDQYRHNEMKILTPKDGCLPFNPIIIGAEIISLFETPIWLNSFLK